MHRLKINFSPLFRLLGFDIGKNTKIYVIKLKRDVKIGEDSFVGEKVTIGNNCVLGKNVQLRFNSILANNVKISDGVIVGKNALIQNMEIGENSMIEYEVLVIGHGDGTIQIGKECYIGVRCVLDFSHNITIGDFVHIAGPSTGLWTHSSAEQVLKGDKLSDKTYRTTKPIKIENNVYIGGNCTIYPGVNIGHHSIVAPNSAVSKNVEPYSLVGGVPARFIRKIVLHEK